ncbi:MAG: glycosyltransferase 28 domain protein, partial [Thermoleophilia bacterium]|nr:glycosyltransferase 28 domain protein [Thermoleophilia bacterium]
VRFVPPVDHRDGAGALRSLPTARRILRERQWGGVVSTGAAIAASYLPLAAAMGIPSHYIESAARTAGPSLTGRLAGVTPRVRCYTQYRRWEDRRWQYGGSVFDGYAPAAGVVSRTAPRRVLVVIGTTTFAFDELVERLEEIVPASVELQWQLGPATREPERGTWFRTIPSTELAELHLSVDMVVTHGGVGSALMALDAGHVPILVPRRRARNEHVDDHQQEIAASLASRGLATACELEELDASVLLAARRSVERVAVPPPFRLS